MTEGTPAIDGTKLVEGVDFIVDDAPVSYSWATNNGVEKAATSNKVRRIFLLEEDGELREAYQCLQCKAVGRTAIGMAMSHQKTHYIRHDQNEINRRVVAKLPKAFRDRLLAVVREEMKGEK